MLDYEIEIQLDTFHMPINPKVNFYSVSDPREKYDLLYSQNSGLNSTTNVIQ